MKEKGNRIMRDNIEKVQKTMKALKSKLTIKQCENCDNLICIGEGDFICYEVCDDDGAPLIMPISDYEPTHEYLMCHGKCYLEKGE